MVWRGSTELTDKNIKGVRMGRGEELRRKEERRGYRGICFFVLGWRGK
jgi:hypothetical protein